MALRPKAQPLPPAARRVAAIGLALSVATAPAWAFATDPAPPARPAELEDLHSQWETAANYFKYQDFDKAVERLIALLYPTSRLDLRRELRAREYLGASYWWQGKREAAADEFTALLVKAPYTRLEPAQYPPKMIDDFEARRRRLIETGAIKGDATAPGADAAVAVRGEAPPIELVFFPFGVGQFATRQPTKGWIVLAGEAALGSFSVWYYLRNRDQGRVGPRPLSDDVIQISAGAAFWLVAAWGAWDAWASHRAQWPDR